MEFNDFAEELLKMRDRDLALRRKLEEAGRLDSGYDPEMERLHRENAARLEAWIDRNGFPTARRVGNEAADAAWLIVQHAIGNPRLMKRVAALLRALPAGEDDPRHPAYLEDRIAMYEGRPQQYGTQFEWNENGILTPALHDAPERVDARRRALGLPTLAETTRNFRNSQRTVPDPETRAGHRASCRQWLAETGWRKPRPRIGISSCLLGRPVRYDGRHKYDGIVVEALSEVVEWVEFCPETGCGLPVPREPVHLTGDPAAPRLETGSGEPGPNLPMDEYCRRRIEELKQEKPAGFLFKSKSPSCGLCVNVHGGRGKILGKAPGLFAAACKKAFPELPVAESDELHGPAVLAQWKDRLERMRKDFSR